MNWKLIGTLALSGVVMGVLSLFGLTRHGIEPTLWLLIALGSAFVISKRAPRLYFLHGLLVGVLIGVANGLVQVVGFDTYLAHNPEAAEALAKSPGGADARTLLLIASPLIGSAYGLVLGGIAFVFARSTRPKIPAR